ncbi:MAG: N-acetylmuramoyl-L-alanine amidase [Paramuribaculum sp.]|nr:N-acetylmuramoyl-L-alanine amidase [Paramuribaculum sp.]
MRTIEKIIIHCSATPAGRAVTVADIDRWHRARGFRCIGYHYVIYPDGSIHPGRAESEIGAHCTGQNARSIGICYIGGCDAAMRPADTRTEAQKLSLRKLVESLRRRYPTASIHGHREFAAKACPSFDVSAEFR